MGNISLDKAKKINDYAFAERAEKRSTKESKCIFISFLVKELIKKKGIISCWYNALSEGSDERSYLSETSAKAIYCTPESPMRVTSTEMVGDPHLLHLQVLEHPDRS